MACSVKEPIELVQVPPPPDDLRTKSLDPDPPLPEKAKVMPSVVPASHRSIARMSKEKTAMVVPGGNAYNLEGLATPEPYLPMYNDNVIGELASTMPLVHVDASPSSKFSNETSCS